MKNTLLAFAAGSLGGLVYCLVMWLFSHYGITQSLGVSLAGSLSPHWVYPRIVWGGLWSLLFLLSIMSSSLFMRSLVLSLIPALVQLFIIFPFYTGQGIAGLKLGLLTPLLVWFFFWCWAFATAVTLRLAR